MADLSYSSAGAFVAFYPETKAGEEAWNELARHSDGTGKFLPAQVGGVVAQLKAAGYTVQKVTLRKRATDAEIDAMLAEIDSIPKHG